MKNMSKFKLLTRYCIEYVSDKLVQKICLFYNYLEVSFFWEKFIYNYAKTQSASVFICFVNRATGCSESLTVCTKL